MIKVATLGPEGTFSDRATKQFFHNECSIHYTGTIKQVFDAMKQGIEYGVVPVENMSEGYVQPTLDSLLDSDVAIVGEIKLSVQFSFVANVETLEKLDTVYVQPVALGQCSEFISSLENVTVIRTNSNIESLLLHNENYASGAIVPGHIYDSITASTKIENVSDYAHNETRFFLLKKGAKNWDQCSDCNAKSSMIIRDDQDHSGILNFITGAFSNENINITAIVSRPTKEMMGKYHFFLDIEGSLGDDSVQRAIKTISEFYPVTPLGSYCRA